MVRGVLPGQRGAGHPGGGAEGGTRLTQIMAKGEGALTRLMFDWQFRKMAPAWAEDMQRFKAHVEADWAQFNAPPPVAVPQALVQSAARDSLNAA